MKTKFKKNGRRLLAAVLCLVMAVMALPMSAFAWTSEEGVSCTSSFGDYYVGSDGGYYRSKSSYSFIVYDSDGNTSVRTISAGNAKRKYLMTDNSGTHQVYCVESGIDFNTGNSYVSQNGKNSSYFRKLPTEAQFGVMMALMYGWHEGTDDPVPFIKYLLGTILAAYKDFEDRFSLVETKKSALETVRLATQNKIGRFTKQDIRELCPALSISSVEGALRKLVASGELKREGSGKSICYYRIK